MQVLYPCIISISACVFFSGNIDPPIGDNNYELDNEEPVENDNGYEALEQVASGSKSSAPENDTLPPVYAAVDKENRQGNTVCKSLEDNYVNMCSKLTDHSLLSDYIFKIVLNTLK